MSTFVAPRRAVKPIRKPVVAELMLHINGTPYVVIPIAPGPDNTKAFRLVKDGCADSVYDVARTVEGLVVCDCPSYVVTYEGNGLATCKHGQALIQVGLLEAPGVTTTVVTAPSPVVSPMGDIPSANAVGHASNFTDDVKVAPLPAEPRLVDDDGTPLETPTEMDARHKAEHAATVAELMDGNPFLPPCCPDDETPPPIRLDFPAWIAYQAAEHARIGGERHSWLAGKIAKLAEQARSLDATTPEAFDERLDCMLDCAAREAEARLEARCC